MLKWQNERWDVRKMSYINTLRDVKNGFLCCVWSSSCYGWGHFCWLFWRGHFRMWFKFFVRNWFLGSFGHIVGSLSSNVGLNSVIISFRISKVFQKVSLVLQNYKNYNYISFNLLKNPKKCSPKIKPLVTVTWILMSLFFISLHPHIQLHKIDLFFYIYISEHLNFFTSPHLFIPYLLLFYLPTIQ